MKLKTIGLAAALLGASQGALAASFKISDIRVEGLQRVSAGTVFNAFPVSADQNVEEEDLSSAARQLFDTGLFDDIRLKRDGDVLIIDVVERPTISKIEIDGNSQIPDEDLRKGLKEAGLAEGQVLQRSTLEEMQRELERVYQAQGRYSARIETSVEELERNRVQVNIDVKEGAVAKIHQINIVGNEAFDDETLREQLELEDKPSWFFGWFSDDEYSREKLTGDIETLKSWYLDRGYVNFQVRSTQVSISPDKSEIFVTINVDEGKPYKIGNIGFAGDLKMKEERARDLVKLAPDALYSQRDVTASSEALRQALGADGFAFAKVNAVPEINEESDTVDLTFAVDPGKRAYVRRINFKGNTTTADEVLRREMTQLEGAPASTDKIKQSKQKLERLGFFKQVDVDTRPVAGESDQLDVNYNVEEQPSGSISASIGFSQGDGVIYGVGLSQKNFLGTGNEVNINAQKSDDYTNVSFGYTDPYWTLDGISRGYNLFYRKVDYDDDDDVASYATDSFGGGINFGYPINELSRLNFGAGYEFVRVKDFDDSPAEVTQFIDDEGEDFNLYKLTASWSRNNLNRGILPTAGSSQLLSLEVAVPGSDADYYKFRYKGSKYFELSRDWSLKFRTELGYANSFSGDTYPFFKNFYAGGLGSVRGYSSNTLGQASTEVDDGDDDTLGGNILIEGGVDLIFPMPFIKDKRSVQPSFFVDAGNTYLTSCYDVGSSYSSTCESGVDLGDLNYSAGIGLSWITPVGPLTFSVAQPIGDDDDDDTEIFQFSLGQTF